jgi:hypothetical protein
MILEVYKKSRKIRKAPNGLLFGRTGLSAVTPGQRYLPLLSYKYIQGQKFGKKHFTQDIFLFFSSTIL